MSRARRLPMVRYFVLAGNGHVLAREGSRVWSDDWAETSLWLDRRGHAALCTHDQRLYGVSVQCAIPWFGM